MKSVFSILKRPLLNILSLNRSSICLRCIGTHVVSNEAKSFPRIINDVDSLDEFQYFSMKIKDLLNEEQLDYFETVIRKVENINHPIADELMREKLHNPMLDLIMNLITKMVNNGNEVTSKQENLSKAIQLIHIGNLVHQRGIFDLSKFPNFGNSLPENHDLILGNKVALLAGDFLLANAQIKITQMRHDEVLRIISSAMCDIIDLNFIGNQDKSGNSLPFKPGQIPKSIAGLSVDQSFKPLKLEGTSGTAEDEWMTRQVLHRAFLIAKGCQASAFLANQTSKVQRNSFELAKFFYLAGQAYAERNAFKVTSGAPKNPKVNLVSAPVLFHLDSDPKLYKTIIDDSASLEGIDHANLFQKIANGPGILKTENLMLRLKKETVNQLHNFPPSEEKKEIENILADYV